MPMDSLFQRCKGDSHKLTDKPCQDFAYAEHGTELSMAIVSDGHGGARYFRSQVGSEFAVTIAKNAIRCFVETMHESSFNRKGEQSVFEQAPLTAYAAASADEAQLESGAHKALQWLFASIINQWNEAIAKHAEEHELDEWEKEHVETKYLEEFKQKRTKTNATYEKTYGCTLMAYVQTPTYWFAFHIGDGKCIVMDQTNEKLRCSQPIPWDERCFLNKTTSLCDTDAVNEFRYCFQGDGHFPTAVFLGSDGLDDSYGDGENLINFYIQLFKIIIRNGKEKAEKELIKSLPVISQRGSKDDMSVACVFDDTNLNEVFRLLNAYQLESVEAAFENIEQKVADISQKIESLNASKDLDEHGQILLKYAMNDLEKAKKQAKRIKYRKSALKGERTKFDHRISGEGNAEKEEEISVIDKELTEKNDE